jgi:hypothetical protein
VSGFDAADVDCLVADCLGVHFVSLSLVLLMYTTIHHRGRNANYFHTFSQPL